MSKRQGSLRRATPLRESIRQLLATRGQISSGEAAKVAAVTRQAAHYQLTRMLAAGEVERVGAGRSARYVRTTDFVQRWPIGDADEDEVWRQLKEAVPCLRELRQNVNSLVAYALTEMVNNAIDHSQGSFFEIALWCRADLVTFEVVDDGVGAFRNVRDKLGLEDEFAAIGQLSKGRETTAPSHHSGEGIFFTSKAVDLFELDSSKLSWVVDNRRHDEAVGDSHREVGTRVRFEIDPRTTRELSRIFEPFMNPETLHFDRTKTTVRLFEIADTFVSRSEAKRLGTHLERFTDVELDFNGISSVGQGFVDELFRVWAAEHRQTRLRPVNTSPAVDKMIRRGLHR